MAKSTIMIIEDDPPSLELYSIIIRDGGYDVLTAKNAKAALDLLKTNTPHLIIEDLSLPDLNGVQLIHCIRCLPNCSQIPVIILSGSAGRIASAKLSPEHFVAFLQKPIEPKQLLENIKQALSPI